VELLELRHFEVHAVEPSKVPSPVEAVIVCDAHHLAHAAPFAHQRGGVAEPVEVEVDIESRSEGVIAQRGAAPAGCSLQHCNAQSLLQPYRI
jgi:hypothetical protein